jgi:hypothetical protein
MRIPRDGEEMVRPTGVKVIQVVLCPHLVQLKKISDSR